MTDAVLLRTERMNEAPIHVWGMSPMKRGVTGSRHTTSCHWFQAFGR